MVPQREEIVITGDEVFDLGIYRSGEHVLIFRVSNFNSEPDHRTATFDA